MRLKILFILIIAFTTGAAGYVGLQRYLDSPLLISNEGYVLEVPPGASFAAVARRLVDDRVAHFAPAMTVHARLTGDARRIQAGEYLLTAGTTPRSLLADLVAGRVLLHRLTIVEGWSLRDIVRVMGAEPALRSTLDSADPRQVARELGLPFDSAEGAFLPETYLFPRGTTDRELLLRAHRALQAELDRAWTDRAADTPVKSPYELLILASIVERETALPGERALIAGVFSRRLQRGMRLQTDPTVIYGLGERFDGNLRRRDLETDTPWNTYTRSGLPPTPIAVASRESLEAAARPGPGTALYFVATGDGDGSHRFSDTLEQHNAAVRQYLTSRRRQAGTGKRGGTDEQ